MLRVKTCTPVKGTMRGAFLERKFVWGFQGNSPGTSQAEPRLSTNKHKNPGLFPFENVSREVHDWVSFEINACEFELLKSF